LLMEKGVFTKYEFMEAVKQVDRELKKKQQKNLNQPM